MCRAGLGVHFDHGVREQWSGRPHRERLGIASGLAARLKWASPGAKRNFGLKGEWMEELSVLDALASRKAVRAFRSTPIPRDVVTNILSAAARAPSGSNTQPWNVHVLAGQARANLSTRLLRAYEADEPGHDDAYQYYPSPWFEPYQTRRRKLGYDLYEALGIARDDHEGRRVQLGRNFAFFGAPVGMIFTLDRRHRMSAWIDLGIFLQSVMLAARGFGLHTCPQQAFARYHQLIRAQLGLPENDLVVCGMALGYADLSAPENGLATEREAVDHFATFHWN